MTNDECRKKLPPPTPDGREGRLFPPEQSWKTSRLLNELTADRNKILCKANRLAQARPAVSSFSCVIWVTTRRHEVLPVPC